MASEIRVDKINSLSGVGTVTLSPTGVDIAGITTAATLRATTGIVTSLTAGSLTSLGAVSGTSGTFSGGLDITSNVDITDSIRHKDDTDTIIRFPSADTVTVETAGSERVRIDSDGKIGIGTASPATDIHTLSGSDHIITHQSGTAGADVRLNFRDSGSVDQGGIHYAFNGQSMRFRTAQGERLRITSAGLVGIATATPRAQFDVIKATGNVIALFEGSNASQNHRVRIDASGASSTSALSISNSNSNNQTSMYHSGGNNNMVIMGGQTAGAEPTAGTAVATFASGGDVTVNTGNLVIGTAGKGIDFSATGDGSGTMTNELLDDYEEGTWSIIVSPGGGSFSVSHMNARYVRIGNVVTVQGWWRAAGISGVSGSLTVSGLPYAALDYSSGGGVRQTLKLDVAHVNYSGLTFVKLRIGNNSSQGSILANTAGASGGLNTWTAGNIALSTELYISGSYITN